MFRVAVLLRGSIFAHVCSSYTFVVRATSRESAAKWGQDTMRTLGYHPDQYNMVTEEIKGTYHVV